LTFLIIVPGADLYFTPEELGIEKALAKSEGFEMVVVKNNAQHLSLMPHARMARKE